MKLETLLCPPLLPAPPTFHLTASGKCTRKGSRIDDDGGVGDGGRGGAGDGNGIGEGGGAVWTDYGVFCRSGLRVVRGGCNEWLTTPYSDTGTYGWREVGKREATALVAGARVDEEIVGQGVVTERRVKVLAKKLMEKSGVERSMTTEGGRRIGHDGIKSKEGGGGASGDAGSGCGNQGGSLNATRIFSGFVTPNALTLLSPPKPRPFPVAKCPVPTLSPTYLHPPRLVKPRLAARNASPVHILYTTPYIDTPD